LFRLFESPIRVPLGPRLWERRTLSHTRSAAPVYGLRSAGHETKGRQLNRFSELFFDNHLSIGPRIRYEVEKPSPLWPTSHGLLCTRHIVGSQGAPLVGQVKPGST